MAQNNDGHGGDKRTVDRPRGRLRHVAGLLTPDAAAGLRAVAERDFRDISLHMGMPPVRPVLPDVLTMMADGSLRPEDVITDTDRIDNAHNAVGRYLSGSTTKMILSVE